MDGSAFSNSRHLRQSTKGQTRADCRSRRPRRAQSAPRRRWLISPEGFRELRLSCLLDLRACAAFLGCSLSTVQAWDRGRDRIPWSAVRLLRLYRLGDLGALHA
ncbi:MAG: hypothetical protein ABI132_03490 [Rhodanobacteraceae bacterium]